MAVAATSVRVSGLLPLEAHVSRRPLDNQPLTLRQRAVDLIVLPAGALQQPLWDKMPKAQLWSSVAGASEVFSTYALTYADVY